MAHRKKLNNKPSLYSSIFNFMLALFKKGIDKNNRQSLP